MMMCQLLIVDDEKIEIDSVHSSLDFQKLGIDGVYDACSMSKAKEQFLQHDIDIMLSDIEMPQGSGLELLEWVKEHYPKTECIFITCHADFYYAKQAIRLGSLDYLLKPVRPEELERVLCKALYKIKKKSENTDNERFSKLWLSHRQLLIEHFWMDLLSQKIAPDYKTVKKAADDMSFSGLETVRVFPILIHVQQWERQLNFNDEKLMEYALKNIACELILKEKENGIILSYGDGKLLALLYLEGQETPDDERLRSDCSRYISACVTYLKCEMCCYLGSAVFSYELYDAAAKLLSMDRNNVCQSNKVLLRNDKCVPEIKHNVPEMRGWYALLKNGDIGNLKNGVVSSLNSLAEKSELNLMSLHQIQQDFMQLISLYLQENEIKVSELFSACEYTELFSHATESVRCLEQWMINDAEKAITAVKEKENSQSTVDRVKDYIARNLDKEVSCEEIAASVFLNPIYLNRVFKKETGMSLTSYMQEERMRVAKELLLSSDISISSVAAQIGYSNFSYFSKMFKKHTGLSPVDFRRTQARKIG